MAESGLRHSTRNRAWGNPPWVRIPPLPPESLIAELRDTISDPEREDEIRANVMRITLTDGGIETHSDSAWNPDMAGKSPSEEKNFLKNVTILDLPGMLSVLHIVCPLSSHAITCC